VFTAWKPFSYRLDRKKLRQTRLREGRYLLRTNLVEDEPAHYLLLMAVEDVVQEPQTRRLSKTLPVFPSSLINLSELSVHYRESADHSICA